jgi:cell division protein FtsB
MAQPQSLKIRFLLLGLLGLLIVLQVRLWVTDEGWPEVLRLRSSVAEQQAENDKLAERNNRLKAEVNDLKQGFSALEERARSDLGMVGPQESFYLFVPAETDTTDAATAD